MILSSFALNNEPLLFHMILLYPHNILSILFINNINMFGDGLLLVLSKLIKLIEVLF